MNIRRTVLRCAVAAALLTTVVGVQTAMTAPPSAPSNSITIDPARILDTRNGIGVPAVGPVGAASSITLRVAGAGGVPADATGVIVTLTAVGATQSTFITATPTGTTRSATSVLNPGIGAAIANTVTMSLGTNGSIDLYNDVGAVHLLADVTGYLVADVVATQPTIETESIELSAYGAAIVGPGNATDFGCVQFGAQSVGSTLYLDVPLPHGAAVQQVEFRWYDNDIANFQMFLSEINSGASFSNPTGGNLSGNVAATTGTAGYLSSLLNISGGDATSKNVRYQIQAFTPGRSGVGTLHMFCGATITYSRVVS